MNLWTQKDVIEATGGEILGLKSSDWVAQNVCMDSRQVKAGDLFIAIKGTRVDGHDYVQNAFDKGAAAVIVSETSANMPEDGRCVRVEDTLQALEALGVAARIRSKARRVGVTGSVGKTTTKEMMAIAFGALGQTHASKASYNNYLGVPFTLSNLAPDAQFGVFEIGMNHAYEITPLSKMVVPDVSIITTIENVHLENFDSPKGIAEAKSEIFDGMKSGAIAVLNKDNKWYDFVHQKAASNGVKVISFGMHQDADSRLISYKGNVVKAHIGGEDIAFEFFLPGHHMAMNALACLTAVCALGEDVPKAAMALKDMRPISGRGEQISVTLEAGERPLTIIDQSYNASPVAVEAGLQAMCNMPCEGRRILVLGDMYELGPDSEKLHTALTEAIHAAKIDLVYTSGAYAHKLYESLPKRMQGESHPDAHELAKIVAQDTQAGDLVFVKGSRGTGERPRMYETVAALIAKGKKT